MYPSDHLPLQLSDDGCDEIKEKVREEQHTLQDLSREFEVPPPPPPPPPPCH